MSMVNLLDSLFCGDCGKIIDENPEVFITSPYRENLLKSITEEELKKAKTKKILKYYDKYINKTFKLFDLINNHREFCLYEWVYDQNNNILRNFNMSECGDCFVLVLPEKFKNNYSLKSGKYQMSYLNLGEKMYCNNDPLYEKLKKENSYWKLLKQTETDISILLDPEHQYLIKRQCLNKIKNNDENLVEIYKNSSSTLGKDIINKITKLTLLNKIKKITNKEKWNYSDIIKKIDYIKEVIKSNSEK